MESASRIPYCESSAWSAGEEQASGQGYGKAREPAMIDDETRARIRRLFHVDHWKAGTIAAELGLHRDTVVHALGTERFNAPRVREKQRITDPYLGFLTETLEQYPHLRSTRIYQMVRDRGYQGSVIQLRRVVRTLRPRRAREAFVRMHMLPGEEGQVDWADFGAVTIGRAERRLSAFVLTLAYSRALYLEFFFDQKLENFLRGHVRAFAALGGAPRVIAHDNLRAAVLERTGRVIRLHPRFREMLAHYRLESRACRPFRGNEKGRVERSIRYVRDSFFAGRSFTTLPQLNQAARTWCEQIALQRPWPGDPALRVAEALEREKSFLLPLPEHPFALDALSVVSATKTIYIRFDRNDYSIPPHLVGLALTLAASDTEIRFLQGSELVARHPRSYDAGQCIEDPSHRSKLLALKHNAGASQLSPALAQVPLAEDFLLALARRGESASVARPRLSSLLREYGPLLLERSLAEVLTRSQTPQIEALRYVLERLRRETGRRLPVPLDLSSELDSFDVQPHSLEAYDGLFDSDSATDSDPE